MSSIGIDLGGSNFRAAAFRGDDPTPIAHHKEPVGDDRAPASIVERVARMVERLAAEVGAFVADGAVSAVTTVGAVGANSAVGAVGANSAVGAVGANTAVGAADTNNAVGAVGAVDANSAPGASPQPAVGAAHANSAVGAPDANGAVGAADANDRVGTNARIPVGVGIAAMLRDREGTVANSPHLRWRDVPFGALLAERLGDRFQLGVYNDVNAITWGETIGGAARGYRDVLAVYVGTGIGGGLVCDGRLVEGSRNCAGEIGHVKVAWGDVAAPCMCGSRGCIEAYAGGSYVERRIASELAGDRPKHSLARQLAGAGPITPSHVDAAAAEGDDWALETWSELASLLAVAIGNALALTNPKCLVLGGGLLSRTPTLYELLVTAISVAAPAPSLDGLIIEPAELGDDAGLVGAASLARSR